MTNVARQDTKRLTQAVPPCEGPPIKKEPEEACSTLVPGVPQQDQARRHAPKRHLEELRMKIVHRRRARGQSEVPDDPAPATHEMTPEEREKKERRKEQNRRAAQKCREKKRAVQSTFAEEFQRMQKENEKLEGEISQLRLQKDVLTRALEDHVQSGMCGHVTDTTAATLRAASTVGPPEEATLTDDWRNDIGDHLQGQQLLETFLDLEDIIREENGHIDVEPNPKSGHVVTQRCHGNRMKERMIECSSTFLSDETSITCSNHTPVDFCFQATGRDRYSVSSVASNISDQSAGFGLSDHSMGAGPLEDCGHPEGVFPTSQVFSAGANSFFPVAPGEDRPLPVGDGGTNQLSNCVLVPPGVLYNDRLPHSAVPDSTDGEDDDVFDVSSTVTSEQLWLYSDYIDD